MDGKALAAEIKSSVKKDVDKLRAEGVNVGLAIMLVGNNPASRSYYSAILKAGEKVGIRTYEHVFSEDASVNEVLNTVNAINNDERVSGLLVLFPLPSKINSRRVVNKISPDKDIDGLGAMSVGRLAAEESLYQIFSKQPGVDECGLLATGSFIPCTPFGVIRLLEHHNIDIEGKHAVVIGKSLAVGKPLSMMLLAKEATVTVCHKATSDLAFHTKQADIICTATGVKGLIKGDMIKEGSVIVDIGINVGKDGSISGDVDHDSVAEKASFITPVPGGVGPVTIAMLLENTVRSAYSSTILSSPYQIE